MRRVAPSVIAGERLAELPAGDADRELNIVSALVETVTRLVVQELLKAEQSDFLGRGRYDRRADGQVGSRNGYERGRLRTAEGFVDVAVPQIRGAAEPFRSSLIGHIAAKVIANPVGAPLCPGEQVLQAVRCGLTAVLGDSPAVLAGPARRACPASAPRRAAMARDGRTAARSDRSPHQTRLATDQRLPCEARPPPRRSCSTRARHAGAVAVFIACDTPTRQQTAGTSNPHNELRP
jgi:Transposase, Mutator family